MLVRALVVASDEPLRQRLLRALRQPNVLATVADSVEEMWRALARDSSDLVLAQHSLLGSEATGIVTALRKLPDRPELVVLQAREAPAERVALLAAGCYEVLSLELPDEALGGALAAFVARRRETLVRALPADLPYEPNRLSDFASASEAMQGLLRVARRVAESDSPLLILGETGVGKEWLARAIHREGPRGRAPFIAVNTAAMPDSLLESELFGHERGAFTGAVRSRRGYFELAHRGTLFLDEIGDTSAALQAKLLRVLQDRQIQRVGGEEPIEVDVRIMAATNRDLEAAIVARDFRSDLYYRLGVVTLTLPPLRERQADIPGLVASYVERFSLQFGRGLRGVADDAMAALVAYPWPGNVRELINIMERSVLLSEGELITLADLPYSVSGRPREPVGRVTADSLSLGLPGDWLERPIKELRQQLLEELDRRYFEQQLRRAQGRVGVVARRAGLDPRSLFDRLRQLGLRKEAFRESRETAS